MDTNKNCLLDVLLVQKIKQVCVIEVQPVPHEEHKKRRAWVKVEVTKVHRTSAVGS